MNHYQNIIHLLREALSINEAAYFDPLDPALTKAIRARLYFQKNPIDKMHPVPDETSLSDMPDDEFNELAKTPDYDPSIGKEIARRKAIAKRDKAIKHRSTATDKNLSYLQNQYNKYVGADKEPRPSKELYQQDYKRNLSPQIKNAPVTRGAGANFFGLGGTGMMTYEKPADFRERYRQNMAATDAMRKEYQDKMVDLPNAIKRHQRAKRVIPFLTKLGVPPPPPK